MIEVISEHSVDLSLLPEKAHILDLGCRGFGFTHAMRERGHIVMPVDIDDLQAGESYYQCAISNYDGYCGIVKTPDPQATRIGKGDSIPCYKLETISTKLGIEFWDLIKCDIEGAEYEMIMSLTKAPAKQLSIEFHIHCGQTMEQVTEMKVKLLQLDYAPKKFDFVPMHGAGFNYWDSVFVLR